MKKRKDYLKPRLTGTRFDDHTIPLEVLKDWAAFEDLIVATAKWLYKSQNPTRGRVPRNFTRDFSINLSAVEDGSAIPILQMEVDEDLAGEKNTEYFERARETVIVAIGKAAANDSSFAELLPPNYAQYFDRFGRSLREGEAFQFQSGGADYNISYTRDVRKRIVVAETGEWKEEELIRGLLSGVDAKTKTFELDVLGGARVSATYLPEISDAVIDSLKTYDRGGRSLIAGTAVRDDADRLIKIENVSRVESLDELDVVWRISEFYELKDGWYDGDQGKAPSRTGLNWLASTWDATWSELPLPYLYPTVSGGLEAEWESKGEQASLTIDIDNKVGVWVSSLDSLEASETRFDLSSEDGWRQLEEAVSKFYGNGSAA
ncbi:hypothetical protein [Burkholderia vietnamiensis]|uniref:hypothetical protein n=1 Tax=Burkholderia vietnamiensis TaxID=60552 RepID=UPI00264F6813|nr:hypothetical protein [Burkholderia vietnamiensis]MDN8037050.1 hypothetical protein [Burkholderia vietnamiensis]